LGALEEVLGRGEGLSGEQLVDLGAYLGEVLRGELGGGRYSGELGEGLTLSLRGGSVCWPVQRVMARAGGDEWEGIVGYAYGMGVSSEALGLGGRGLLTRLPKRRPKRPRLHEPPAWVAREALVARVEGATLAWPVFMHGFSLDFGWPIERLGGGADPSQLAGGARRALGAVRYATVEKDKRGNVQELYEPGAFAADAGLAVDEEELFETLAAVSVYATPEGVRVEPLRSVAALGGIEPATWLAVHHEPDVPDEALGRSIREALDSISPVAA
jgi:hypothetical protein